MRKLLWCSSFAAGLFVGSLFWSAWDAYTNPHSLSGRCATACLQFSMRVNPLLTGFMATLTDNDSSAVVQPSEPCAFEETEPVERNPLVELKGVYDLPLQPVPIVIEQCDLDRYTGLIIAGSKEPPLADRVSNESPQTITFFDPAVQQAAGRFSDDASQSTRRRMPYCKDDDAPSKLPCPVAAKEECQGSCWFSLCWKAVMPCQTETTSPCDHSWFSCWVGFFSSPSILDPRGDADLSEPKDLKEETANSEPDKFDLYHRSEYSHSGVCPFSGRMPSYDIPATEPKKAGSEEPSEPMKDLKMKIKLPTWWGGETEASEDTPVPTPGVDTMEFRRSDRSWGDYGPPYPL